MNIVGPLINVCITTAMTAGYLFTGHVAYAISALFCFLCLLVSLAIVAASR